MCKETTEGRRFDQMVKGNISIKKVSEHRYKITFKIGKFLVYQVWDKYGVILNNKCAVDYVSAKKWVTAFKKSNEELEDGDEPLFTPTIIIKVIYYKVEIETITSFGIVFIRPGSDSWLK